MTNNKAGAIEHLNSTLDDFERVDFTIKCARIKSVPEPHLFYLNMWAEKKDNYYGGIGKDQVEAILSMGQDSVVQPLLIGEKMELLRQQRVMNIPIKEMISILLFAIRKVVMTPVVLAEYKKAKAAEMKVLKGAVEDMSLLLADAIANLADEKKFKKKYKDIAGFWQEKSILNMADAAIFP